MLEELAKFLVSFTNELGYIGIYLYMTIVGSFIPLPSQVILIPAGYLASKGDMNFGYIWIAATLGSTTGATINYFLANKLLRTIMKSKEQLIIQTEAFFEKHAKISLFLAPLTIGAGQYISIPAGLGRTKLTIFWPITFAGNMIFNFLMILIGYAFNPDEANQKAIYVTISLLAFVVITATFYIYKQIKK